LRNLALQQAELDPLPPDVISEGFEFSRVGQILRFSGT